MAAADNCSERLKREDFARLKGDSRFSQWRLLVGASDWEDHARGKEGVPRYRIDNLPKNISSGIYEIGIALSPTASGREISKLDPCCIVVAYLGHADNIRTRLQQYGRSGAHLGGSSSAVCLDDCEAFIRTGTGFFREVLSRGYSVVYRWAPMKSKEDALQREAKLLDNFDYAWNKGRNGVRRPNVIFQKLNNVSSNPACFSIIRKKPLPAIENEVGIKIEAAELLSSENKSGRYSHENSFTFLHEIFEFKRAHPRLVPDKCSGIGDNDNICGVALGNGSICMVPPVQGRKRCKEHKGLKTNGFSLTLIKGNMDGNKEADNRSRRKFSYNDRPKQIAGNCPVIEEFHPICGFILNDGSPCPRKTAQGRKRCDQHKGRIIRETFSTSVTDKEPDCLKNSQSFLPNYVKEPPEVPFKISLGSKDYKMRCGVSLGNGDLCMKQPVEGRVRCEEHKRMKVKSLTSTLVAKQEKHLVDVDVKAKYIDSSISFCGAATMSGSTCRRKLANGEKRCWQHLLDVDRKPKYTYSFSSLCGAPTKSGSSCRRKPANGESRCWQHMGM